MSVADTRGPRTLRGALVSIDPVVPIPRAVVFQYNPDAVERTVKARSPREAGERLAATRLAGAPQETVRLDVEIDAADQLAQADPQAVSLGIYPQLSGLEMLVYPSSLQVIANAALLAAGSIELLPPPAPLTLLVWGIKRIVPVRVDGLTVSEQAHDPGLNPIRARVGLELAVLTYEDLSVTNPGWYVFLAHQVLKEGMALLNTAGDLTAVAGSNLRLL